MEHKAERTGFACKGRRCAGVPLDDGGKFAAAQIGLHVELAAFETALEHLFELPEIILRAGARGENDFRLHRVIHIAQGHGAALRAVVAGEKVVRNRSPAAGASGRLGISARIDFVAFELGEADWSQQHDPPHAPEDRGLPKDCLQDAARG